MTERYGNTYVTTGIGIWLLGAILVLAFGVVFLIVAPVMMGLVAGWRWLSRRYSWPKTAAIILGNVFLLGIVVKINGALLEIPGAGGYVAAILFDIGVPLALVGLGWYALATLETPTSPPAAPTGSVPTSVPPLSGSEQIRQTRGWS
jgi:hypothetical protein